MLALDLFQSESLLQTRYQHAASSIEIAAHDRASVQSQHFKQM
jgi:hypothetical protein